MNTAERVVFIVNPRSAGGGTGRRIPDLERAAARSFEHWTLWKTEHPGHGSELATRAGEEGFDIVVAVGGDGTANEVVNGLFDGKHARFPEIRFAVIPAGTGSDLVKTLKMPKELDAAVEIVASGKDRPVDVIATRFTGHDGAPTERVCINVAGFGMNGEVVRRANAGKKRLGGLATFAKATIASVLTYTPPQVEVTWVTAAGQTQKFAGAMASTFVSNGSYCGGGMCVGPDADIGDGRIELTLIPDLPIHVMARSGLRLYTGTVAQVEGVLFDQVISVEAKAEDGVDVRIDIDGEQPGSLPIMLEVVSKSLFVRALW